MISPPTHRDHGFKARTSPARPPQNSAAANPDFAEKKQRYFATDGQVSPSAITTTVIEEACGMPGLLRERQEALLAEVAAMWSL